MNHYRRYPQTHAAKTAHLSLMEEGAYSRLLDWQYSNESPLPATPEERYRITRAITAAERRATEKIAATFFHAAGWQPRAREEIEGNGRGEQTRPEPAPREAALPPMADTAAGRAVASPSPAAPPPKPSPAHQPDDRTKPPSILPRAILELGEKLLGAHGMGGKEIHQILEDLCEVMGQGRGYDLLRQCEREAPGNPGPWLVKALDAHEATAVRA